MRRERERPKVRLSLFDRISLAASSSRRVDGIWIGSFRGSKEDLTRIVQALALVRQYSPVHYACTLNNLERIWITVLKHNGAEYQHSLKACVFDERFLADKEASTNRIASAILHEATHARRVVRDHLQGRPARQNRGDMPAPRVGTRCSVARQRATAAIGFRKFGLAPGKPGLLQRRPVSRAAPQR